MPRQTTADIALKYFNAITEKEIRPKLLEAIHKGLNQKNSITNILKNVGELGPCKGCQAQIYWVIHRKSGARTPYSENGQNHFIDCPAASNFRKPKGH